MRAKEVPVTVHTLLSYAPEEFLLTVVVGTGAPGLRVPSSRVASFCGKFQSPSPGLGRVARGLKRVSASDSHVTRIRVLPQRVASPITRHVFNLISR